jgi:DNA polymerase-4
MVPKAMELFKNHYRWYKPIRSLGIRGTDLVPAGSVYQLTLDDDERRRQKLTKLERTVDRIRGQYGHSVLQRAVLLKERFKGVNANNDNGDAQVFYVYR